MVGSDSLKMEQRAVKSRASRVAKLTILAGYVFLLPSIVIPIFPGSNDGATMRRYGLPALGCVLFSIGITYREVKSSRRYYATVVLLIFAIICATAYGWILVTAPIWSVPLMLTKKRWFGLIQSKQGPDPRP